MEVGGWRLEVGSLVDCLKGGWGGKKVSLVLVKGNVIRLYIVEAI